MKGIVQCPACEQKLRIPLDRGKLTVTCPRTDCRATFSFDPFAGHENTVHRKRRATGFVAPILALILLIVLLGPLFLPVSNSEDASAREFEAAARIQPYTALRDDSSQSSIEASSLSSTTQSSENSLALDGRFPKRWRIGEIDPRFNISESEVRKAVINATAIWDKAAGQVVFAYDEVLGFPISLVFDSRQEQENIARDEQRELKRLRANLDSCERSAKSAAQLFKDAKAELQEAVDSYNTRLEQHNSEVRRLNSVGDVPSEIAADMNAKKSRFAVEKQDLESEQAKVQRLVSRLNERIEQAEVARNALNSFVDRYNSKFGNVAQIVGECLLNESFIKCVNVYRFSDTEDLTRTLAHELGHALGLKHIPGDGALMSAVEDGAKGVKVLKLTSRDVKALEELLNN